MSKIRFATVWMDGCSGCHMSFLDIDERILQIAPLIDLVYSPLVDAKEFPENVDVVLIEGAVSSEEDLEKILKVRSRSTFLVALGDCAGFNQHIPHEVSPALLPKSRPVHEFVKVDLFVPGCPPPADAIFFVLSELLAGRVPDVSKLTRFGK